MNWNNLTKQLEAEWRRFEAAESEASHFDANDPSIERESRARSAVDAAIREFARTKTWPELSRDERYFLQQRLYYGWLLMDSLSPSESGSRMFLMNPENNGAEDAFEWLLIEVWPMLGIPMWLEAQAQNGNSPNATEDAVSSRAR
jgi:hypothetical protein